MEASYLCWETGIYTDECICEICDHRNECSGFDEYEQEKED